MENSTAKKTMPTLAPTQDTKANIRAIERKVEKNPNLNFTYGAVELGIWFVLATLISLKSASIGTAAFFMGIVAIYHAFLFYTVHRHTFNYAYPKMVPHLMRKGEPFPLRRLWIAMIAGHLAILFFTAIHIAAGVIVGLVAPIYARKLLTREWPIEYEAGARPVSLFRVEEHFRDIKDPRDNGVFFGGVMLPTQDLTTHTKIVGTTRSGKTNVLRLMMQDALPHAFASTRARAFIYDPKSEFFPILAGMGIDPQDIKILNPLDARGYAWDLAKDFTTDPHAESLAGIIIPENPNAGSGRFFDDASRILITAIIKLFMEYAPAQWTLRDIILASESVELISVLMQNDPHLQADLKAVGQGETAGNVMATLASRTRTSLRTVAAYEHYHMSEGRTFTLNDWLNNQYILLLGNDRENKETLKAFNNLLTDRVSQLLTSRKTEGYTFVILDELPELGKVGNIERVAKLGASYGVCLTIAFQSWTDLKEIYGENTANSLIGQCDKSAYLRVLDDQTAEWEAKQIGRLKVKRKMKTSTAGISMSGKEAMADKMQTVSEQFDKDYVFQPEFFMYTPKPGLETAEGVTGVYRVGEFMYQHEISSQQLSLYMKPARSDIAEYDRIGDRRLKLPRWTRDDAERLNFSRILQGISIEQLEGTDLHQLLSHADLEPDMEFAPIPIPSFLEAGDNDAGNDASDVDGFDTTGNDADGRAVTENQPYHPQQNRPGQSPRR